MTRNLFVYGTLEPDNAPSEIRDVVQQLKPVSKASVRGRLYGLDGYPGLALTSRGKSIEGRVFELPAEAESTLKQLDAYEEYDPGRPNKSLFRRVLCRPLLKNGNRTTAWIYVYNRPVRPEQKLNGGRWSAANRVAIRTGRQTSQR